MLALVGPTGTGKSRVALDAAAAVGAEIVAVDAFTVYRGMDIGTAKPGPADRARVAHHLVDVLDPQEDCTVAWFQAAARRAIDGVLARGHPPLLVGGSGLYFRAVVDPLELPPTDPAVRAELEARYGADPAAAHAALTVADPAAAAAIEPTNLRRAVRALEVLAVTGRPFSDFRRAWDRWDPVYPRLRVVGLSVARRRLVAALDARVDAMVGDGLVEECRRLARRPLSRTARQAIGYREILDALASGGDVGAAIERTKVRTRRYAARQARWFAADPRVSWVDPADAPEVLRSLFRS